MYFKRLMVNNFGPFYGEHEICLNVEDDHKRIVLVGALNGSGKTTIQEAIQIALFGKLSAPARRFKKGSYESFLENFINTNTTSEYGASVELEFSFREDGKIFNYLINRSWRKKKARIEENLDLYVNGTRDVTGAEMWHERIQDIFPPRIASLFFFDGEQIEELADIDKLSATLREAMYSLLGLDLVEQLATDLNVLKKTKVQKASGTSKELKSQITSIEQRIIEYEAEISTLESKLLELLRSKELRDTSITEKENEFKAIGGEIFSQNAQFLESKKSLEARKYKLLHDQRDLAESALPFALIKDTLLAELGYELNKINKKAVANDLIKKFKFRDARVLDLLTESKLQTEALNKVEQILTEDLKILAQDASELRALELGSGIEFSAFEHLNSEIVKNVDEATSNERELKLLDSELLEIERKLAALPSENRIAKLKGELESFQHDKIRLETLISKQRDLISSAAYKLQNAKSQIAHLVSNQMNEQLEGTELNQFNRTTSWVSDYLNEFKKQVVLHNIKKIELIAGISINKLMRKANFVSKVYINPDNFGLTLLGTNEELIDIDLLSAGERQVIATAVLWSLAQTSSISYPTVIDTPLGRLDSRHRKALCTEYFPKASNQVVLLSTDEEIIGNYHEIIKPHCASEITISYEENKKSSVVRKGYFAQEVHESVY